MLGKHWSSPKVKGFFKMLCFIAVFIEILTFKSLGNAREKNIIYFHCMGIIELSVIIFLLTWFNWNFYFLCRVPNPDTVLVIHTPLGVFSSKRLLKNNDKKSISRLIKKVAPLNSVLPSNTSNPLDVARCIAYNNTQAQVYHQAMEDCFYGLGN